MNKIKVPRLVKKGQMFTFQHEIEEGPICEMGCELVALEDLDIDALMDEFFQTHENHTLFSAFVSWLCIDKQVARLAIGESYTGFSR